MVLDAGTGLNHLDTLLEDRAFQGTILFGHLHWDHTHGLPFFRAADRVGAATRLLIPDQGTPAEEIFDRFMSPPSFPVRVADLDGHWSMDSIEAGCHIIEGFNVLALDIPHKGGRTFGYRISDGTSSIAYLSDHGPRATMGPGPHGWGPYHAAALELCAGVELLIHDAQHTSDELQGRYHYGHSSAEYAVELGKQSGARRVLLFHHDPSRTDDHIDALVRRLQQDGSPIVEAARQGSVHDVC